MEIDAAAQTRDRHGAQQPRLEYSYWQGQELPDNTLRVCKPVVPLRDEAQGSDDWQSEQGHQSHHHHEAWTIQDWQHQGYQRILTRHKSFSVNNALTELRDGEHNPDISIQVEQLGTSQRGLLQHDRNLLDLFTYAPQLTDTAHQSSLFLPPILPSIAAQRGGLSPAQLGDPVPPSPEGHRAERANSRSPRPCGNFGRH